MYLILVRHGESVWNKENKFTGWVDVDLSKKGEEEALDAAKKIDSLNIDINLCFTSILKRAIHTLDIIYNYLNLNCLVIKNYNLNERHYGALQGLNKDECKVKFGDELFLKYRRSFDTRPPMITENNLSIRTDVYNPKSESLHDTYNRVVNYFNQNIKKELTNKNILIAAHGNTLRSLIKYLDNNTDSDIEKVEVKTGEVIIYEFDENLNVISKKTI